MTNNISHIPLPGLYNLRDIGGILNKDGKITRYGQFFRSDCPKVFNNEVASFFESANLRLVIDLRGEKECKELPCALKGKGDWKYINIPVTDFTDVREILSGLSGIDKKFPLSYLYRLSLDSSASASKMILEEMSQAEGAVLFHCMHGKDRTGITAAFLLMLAGVPDDEILADYSVSMAYMRPVLYPIIRRLGSEYAPLFRSDYENMEIYLDAFREKFGDVNSYCKNIGLSSETKRLLRNKLLE